MVLTFYYMAGSAPCHQVLLTAKALNLDLQHKTINLMAKEQLAPEYVKINPQHTVPTLTDDEFALWESRAISRYLVNKYGPDSGLYPQEARARAVVDQRLDFDFGTLYQRFADYFYPQIMEAKEADPAKLKKVEEALGFLDIFLDGSKYVAGSQPTIADFAIVATIATYDIAGIDLKPYPNILRWFNMMKSTTAGYDDAVQKNLEGFVKFLAQAKNKTFTQDKMVLTLYYMVGSAPCHQVLLTARALKLDLQHKTINLMAKEQLAPEYVKINPQHTVPTLTDDELSLWESRAISRYLVNQYGASSGLYPPEPRGRALVDQRLDFDFGTLYHRFADYFYPQMMEGKEADPAKLKKLEEALGFLDIFLDGSKYVAGFQQTIADFAIVATVATFEVAGINMKAYSNVLRWFDMMKSTTAGYEDAVQKNLEVFTKILEQFKNNKTVG